MELIGSLEDFSLPDVFRIIEQGNKTGLLKIIFKEQEGDIYFKDGQIIHSKCGNLQGEKSVDYFFTWPIGNFSFNENASCSEATINISLSDIIHKGVEQAEHWKELAGKLQINSLAVLQKEDFDENSMSETEFTILSLLKNNKCPMSLYDLVYNTEQEVLTIGTALETLVSKGFISITSDYRLKRQNFFEQALTILWEEVMSISGWKLINELNNKFEELNEQNNWNFILEQGKIKDMTKFYSSDKSQEELYKTFWNEITQMLGKIHGSAFIERVKQKIQTQFPSSDLCLLKEFIN